MSDQAPAPGRTTSWQAMNAAAREGVLKLPRCARCGAWQYPLREICRSCLGDDLQWQPVDPRGRVLSWTRIHVSTDPFFRTHGPWPVGSVRLNAGPVLICHLAGAACASGAEVEILLRPDANGEGVLVGVRNVKQLDEFRQLLGGDHK